MASTTQQEGATAGTDAGAGPMDSGFPWGPVVRLVVTLFAIAGSLALLVAGVRWALALILLFGLRMMGDLLLITTRDHATGRNAASLFFAATWAYLPIAVTWIVYHTPPLPLPLWLIGLALTTGGLALLAHQERENTRTPGAGRGLGRLGLLCAALGAGLATTGALGDGLQILVASAVSIASLVLLVLLRPRATPDHPKDPESWGWLRNHRIRMLLLLLPVAAYLITRPLLADVDLLFPLWAWEFIAGVLFVSFLLWAVRAQLRPLLTEDPLQSPHHRHEPSITRHSEPGFDEWESAADDFLRRGDKSGVNRLAQELERTDQVPATKAFSTMLSLRTRSFILLVDPAWLYAANLIVLALFALIAHRLAGDLQALLEIPGGELGPVAAALAASGGLYTIQANRHGGPWWIKTLTGYLGLVLFLLLAWRPLQETLLSKGLQTPTPVLVLLLLILAVLPLLHAARARSHTPRYAYNGHNPAQALEETIRTTQRVLMTRTLWIGGIGLVVLAASFTLTRAHPAYALLPAMYALLAVPLLIVPGVTVLGLRLGRRRIERITRHETDHRKEHLERALQELEAAYERQRRQKRSPTQRPPRGVP